MNVLLLISDQLFGSAILRSVAERAWADSTSFKILHVFDDLVEDTQVKKAILASYHKERIKLLDTITSDLKSEFPSVAVDKVIRYGNAETEILQIANEWPADLIIMGSHSRTGFDLIVMGSVALAVASKAPCSVSIVKVKYADQLDLKLVDADMPQQICSFDLRTDQGTRMPNPTLNPYSTSTDR
jgi:nucleotide-binding universal stress UspA family protein